MDPVAYPVKILESKKEHLVILKNHPLLYLGLNPPPSVGHGYVRYELLFGRQDFLRIAAKLLNILAAFI